MADIDRHNIFCLYKILGRKSNIKKRCMRNERLKFRNVFILVVLIYYLFIYSQQIHALSTINVNICFSSELLGNTRGEFDISKENEMVVTPFGWFNDIARDYHIRELKQLYHVKNQQ